MKPKPSNSVSPEAAFLADQLRRAFDGSAWHGPAVLELLKDIDAVAACRRAVPGAHTIWELVEHIAVWDAASLVRLAGEKSQPTGSLNFPPMPHMPSATKWRNAVARMKQTHEKLVKVVSELSDDRLRARVPGKRYNFLHMLHGVAQHELYHAGQIAILKKAAARAEN